MYCPKCKIDTGKEQFCENCGTETVDKLDNISITESYEKQDKGFKMNKPSMPKMDFKSLIKLGIVAVVVIALFIGYSSMKSMYSVDATVEKYVNYITDDKAKKAFGMLDIKESDFATAEQFEKYIEKLDIKGKESKVRPSNEENKFYGALSDMQKQYSDIMPRDIKFYKAQIESDVYPIIAIRKGKKFGMFDNWVIGSEGITKEWKIQAPKGTKVYVDGKEIEKIDEVNTFGGFNALFAPENRNYIISSIFPNDYEIKATLEGAKDIKKVSNPESPVTVLGFEASEELVNDLTKVTEDFLKLYYADAEKSEFKDIVHEECKFFDRTDNGFKTYKSRTFKGLEVMGSSIDDLNHARLDATVTFDYEQDKISNFFTGETEIEKGTANDIFNLSFKKVGDKWVIVDTGYLH